MRWFVVIAILLAVTAGQAANVPRPAPRPLPVAGPPPPIALKPIFLPILHNSARIFSGTVLAVEHVNSSPSSTLAVTRIRFRVEEAIRGVHKGQVFEIKEWAGLWEAGERYRPGERVLLFLYPPSRLGLTSPVGHRAGRFPLDANGRVLLTHESGVLPQPIDVRRVAAAIRGALGE
ncbi:MAG TPA: hypothetical protein VJO35_08595 [Terriglobales bacterium]|nr:hypothetical protein [Terriglobales bacterium]